MRSRARRCARCTSRSGRRRSRRTTCTVARPSCTSRGRSSSVASGAPDRARRAARARVSESLPTLRVICGPTAAGKSALAMRLASRHPITIVSADSRQVYREFDVGTAKPTTEERRAVPHEGIDVSDPVVRYSASMWAEAADGWIARSVEQGRAPVVVGGTGLYIRALVAPLFDAPPLDEGRRRKLD